MPPELSSASNRTVLESAASPRIALDVLDVYKRYGGVLAVGGVSMRVEGGEVRAIVGQNGAGKSTLVEMISGSVRPDSGSIYLGGRPLEAGSPRAALAAGVATVHQELSLVPELSVAENICLGRWPTHVVRRSALRTVAIPALERIGADVDPDLQVSSLEIADRQLVEIAKALSYEPNILILDEPTSSLDRQEVDNLVALVRRVAEAGVSVIYISHRLVEIPAVADSVTVMSDGIIVDTVPAADIDTGRLASMMIAGVLAPAERRSRTIPVDSSVRLRLRGMQVPGRVEGVDLDVRAGEVVGLAGLLGAGRSELLRAIVGIEPLATGTVDVDDKRITHRSPRRLARCGVALVPNDRKGDGLALDLSVEDNLIMSSFRRVSRAGFIFRSRVRRLVRDAVAKLGIHASSPRAPASSLSGGNQQKIVVGKWLTGDVRVLLMDEPTRGVDVGAKAEIYGIVHGLKSAGMSVLVGSLEIEELFEMCDRIVVMKHGRAVADLETRDTTPEALLSLLLAPS